MEVNSQMLLHGFSAEYSYATSELHFKNEAHFCYHFKEKAHMLHFFHLNTVNKFSIKK